MAATRQVHYGKRGGELELIVCTGHIKQCGPHNALTRFVADRLIGCLLPPANTKHFPVTRDIHWK